jgi:hypothetical protein
MSRGLPLPGTGDWSAPWCMFGIFTPRNEERSRYPFVISWKALRSCPTVGGTRGRTDR